MDFTTSCHCFKSREGREGRLEQETGGPFKFRTSHYPVEQENMTCNSIFRGQTLSIMYAMRAPEAHCGFHHIMPNPFARWRNRQKSVWP